MTWLEQDRSRGESKCHRVEESCEEDVPVLRYVLVIATICVALYEIGVEAVTVCGVI